MGWGGIDYCSWNKGNETPAAMGPGTGGGWGQEQNAVAQPGTVWRPGTCKNGWLWAQGTGMDAMLGTMLCKGTAALLGDGGSLGGWKISEGMDAVFGMDAVLGHRCCAGARMLCWGRMVYQTTLACS